MVGPASDDLVRHIAQNRRHRVDYPARTCSGSCSTHDSEQQRHLRVARYSAARRHHGPGSSIDTASFVALMGYATSQLSYTAAKGGVLALSRELDAELGRRGVRVNALVDTPLLRELYANDPRTRRAGWCTCRWEGSRADEIASAALFLASDESSYVNATAFLVDGGISGAYTTPS